MEWLSNRCAHPRRASGLGIRIGLALAFGALTLAPTHGAVPGPSLTIRPTHPIQLTWPSEEGFVYSIEATPTLDPADWRTLTNNLAGTGAPLEATTSPDSAQRFFRALKSPKPGPQISPQAVDPVPGQVLGPGTIIGSPFLGLQFTIPTQWKGGVRQGSSTMLYASDTDPGLVIGFIALAGDAAKLTRALADSIPIGQFGGFQSSATPQVNGNKLAAEWTGVGFDDQFNSLQGTFARAQATLHPSGGAVVFVGFFTEANRTVMARVLNSFTDSTLTVPRKTRQDLIDVISGKSFLWVKSSAAGSGGSSGSLQRWTEKRAFFCPGTYEVTTQSESSYSGNLSGGGFYTGYSSSNSSEAGDWTIIDTDAGPALIMISGNGVDAALVRLGGNSMFFGDQQFDYQRPHACPNP